MTSVVKSGKEQSKAENQWTKNGAALPFTVRGALLIILITALSCRGATVITNFIPDSFNWDSNGSPYVLQSDVYIPYMYELDIGPGVEVLFSSTDASAAGADTNRIEFTVAGRLIVLGTPERPVTFRAISNNAAAVWAGINADTCCAGAGFRMQNARIFNAVYGLHFSYAREYYTRLDGVTLATNSFALQSDAGTGVQVARARIYANSSGLAFFGGSAWVSECVINNNGGDAIYIEEHDTNPSASITAILQNNTIYANEGAGLRINGPSSQYDYFNILNLIVVSNRDGVVREPAWADPMPITASDVFGNGDSNYVNISEGPLCISVDPRLDENGFLRRGSPCIDSGTGLYNDDQIDSSLTSDILRNPRTVDDPHTPNTGQGYPDGAVTDVGAFEYQPPAEIISLAFASKPVISFSTVPGKQYQLQFTPDFITWSNAGSLVVGTGGLTSVTNANGTNAMQRFYRVQSMPAR